MEVFPGSGQLPVTVFEVGDADPLQTLALPNLILVRSPLALGQVMVIDESVNVVLLPLLIDQEAFFVPVDTLNPLAESSPQGDVVLVGGGTVGGGEV